jgi:peptidoglycan hydrolase-like protein with peptidoglycan-binding domain
LQVTRCSGPTLPAVDSNGDPTLAGIVDLLISLNIIPPDRAVRACQALASAAAKESTNGSLQKFLKPLMVGMTDQDVARLQMFLNTHGFTVANNGPGARGQESTYYGQKTADAVIRFQEAYRTEVLTPAGLTRGSGYFGPATIKKVNELL